MLVGWHVESQLQRLATALARQLHELSLHRSHVGRCAPIEPLRGEEVKLDADPVLRRHEQLALTLVRRLMGAAGDLSLLVG